MSDDESPFVNITILDLPAVIKCTFWGGYIENDYKRIFLDTNVLRHVFALTWCHNGYPLWWKPAKIMADSKYEKIIDVNTVDQIGGAIEYQVRKRYGEENPEIEQEKNRMFFDFIKDWTKIELTYDEKTEKALEIQKEFQISMEDSRKLIAANKAKAEVFITRDIALKERSAEICSKFGFPVFTPENLYSKKPPHGIYLKKGYHGLTPDKVKNSIKDKQDHFLNDLQKSIGEVE